MLSATLVNRQFLFADNDFPETIHIAVLRLAFWPTRPKQYKNHKIELYSSVPRQGMPTKKQVFGMRRWNTPNLHSSLEEHGQYLDEGRYSCSQLPSKMRAKRQTVRVVELFLASLFLPRLKAALRQSSNVPYVLLYFVCTEKKFLHAA